MLYNSTPLLTGGFTNPAVGSSGYYNLSQGLPWYQGRSVIGSIPEYARNPLMFTQDLFTKIQEGRLNMMRLLYNYASKNGIITRPDVKYRWQTEIAPHKRFYLALSSAHTATTFIIAPITTKPTTIPEGLPVGKKSTTAKDNIVGDVARLQVGQLIALMFSYTVPGRAAHVSNFRQGQQTLGTYKQYIPELCKIESINYAAGTITVERNWAGRQRTAASTGSAIAPNVIANGLLATCDDAYKVRYSDAFFVALPKAMKEDEIDGRIFNTTKTWQDNIMQRNLRAWGAGKFGEVINANLGNGSKLAESKALAIDQYWSEIELNALWGESDEGFDELGQWWGMTDGFMANVPASHYVGLKPIDFSQAIGTANYWGSFRVDLFNNLLKDKAYIGSQNKILLCGSSFHVNFASMMNAMTTAFPSITGEWKVVGNRFSSSNGLQIDVVPSDTMSLNGMDKMAYLIDPAHFRMVGLQGYPMADIVEVKNENPLLSNGFIHGVHSFANTLPESQWVFVLDNTVTAGSETYGA
jgi:hypothetical protein